MTRAEKIAREEARDAERLSVRDDALLLCAGAGVCNAGLITLMASADAFSARLAASTQTAAELSTLQMRQLALSLAEMQSMQRSLGDTGVAVRSVSSSQSTHPPGYPVVT